VGQDAESVSAETVQVSAPDMAEVIAAGCPTTTGEVTLRLNVAMTTRTEAVPSMAKARAVYSIVRLCNAFTPLLPW